jgi:hypothetical protein
VLKTLSIRVLLGYLRATLAAINKSGDHEFKTANDLYRVHRNLSRSLTFTLNQLFVYVPTMSGWWRG